MESKILGDFYKRATHLKPNTVANTGNQALFTKLKTLFTTKEEGISEQEHQILQDKMLSVLLLNYIDTHH